MRRYYGVKQLVHQVLYSKKAQEGIAKLQYGLKIKINGLLNRILYVD